MISETAVKSRNSSPRKGLSGVAPLVNGVRLA